MKLRKAIKKIIALGTGTCMVGATMMGALAAATIISYARLQTAKDRLSYPTESRYADYKNKRKTYNTLLIVTLSAWGLNILDAALFPGSNGKKKNQPLALEYNPESNVFSLSARFRF